jgi:hypothetical protein
MTKPILLSLANATLYLVTCTVIGTGLLLELRMDEEDGEIRLLGMGRDDWGEVHLAAAIGFVALTALHLVLNWAWIKAAVIKTKWTAPMLAAGFGIVMALLVWPTGQKSWLGELLKFFD